MCEQLTSNNRKVHTNKFSKTEFKIIEPFKTSYDLKLHMKKVVKEKCYKIFNKNHIF